MENKQAVAVAVGVGAVGTLLAYMGYSVYNSNKDTDNLVAKKSWWENMWKKNTGNPIELYNDETKETDTPKNVKLQAVKKSSAWGKFWHNSHVEMNKEDKSNEGD
tara:strand:+ start:518 stop:832 length:315 start_codon:yes stop_codon:yes gene_type:complete